MGFNHGSSIVYETIGAIGFGLNVLNYTLLTLRYIDGHDVIYFGAMLEFG